MVLLEEQTIAGGLGLFQVPVCLNNKERENLVVDTAWLVEGCGLAICFIFTHMKKCPVLKLEKGADKSIEVQNFI